MHVLMGGGGTGGHLYPGLSLADALKKLSPESEIRFVGSRVGLEADIVPKTGYPLHTVSVGRGAPLSWRHPLNLPRFLRSILQSIKLFRAYRPDVFVSLGGFAAAAPGLVAWALDVPIVVLEQNTVPGRVTRMLSRWAAQVHLQFAEAARHLPQGATFFASGSPVRDAIRHAVYPPILQRNALLVLGGSQGAKRVNELVCGAAKTIQEKTGCEILHVAGTAHEASVRQAYADAGVRAEVWGLTDDMPSLYARARLSVARSGAGSIAELQISATPAVFLPLPTSKDGHQLANAQVVAHGGGAVVEDENMLTPDALAECVSELWTNPERLQAMSAAAGRMACPDAGERIAAEMLRLLKPNETKQVTGA